MTDRNVILKVLDQLKTSGSGICFLDGSNCPHCPLSRTYYDGPCGSSGERYRVRKLEYLVRFLQAHNMQDLLDANPWVLTLAKNEDAYYASLPL